MSDEPEKNVETLVRKARDAEKAADAMQFSQAALNAAHAMQVLACIKGK